MKYLWSTNVQWTRKNHYASALNFSPKNDAKRVYPLDIRKRDEKDSSNCPLSWHQSNGERFDLWWLSLPNGCPYGVNRRGWIPVLTTTQTDYCYHLMVLYSNWAFVIFGDFLRLDICFSELPNATKIYALLIELLGLIHS